MEPSGTDFPGDKPVSPDVAKSAVPARVSAPGIGGQLDLRQALIVIRSHLLVAVAIAMVVCTLLGWQQMNRPKRYASTATLAIERRDTRMADFRRFDDGERGEWSAVTRLGELKSEELVDYVVNSLTPEERARVMPGGGKPERLRAIVRNSANAARVPESLLLSVIVSHSDPEVAALLANRYAEQFIRYLFDKSTASSNAGLAFLRDQAEDLRKKLETSERSLQEYRGRYNLVSLDDSQNIVVDRLKSLNASATAARVRRSEIEVRLQQAEAALKEKRSTVELANLTGSPALTDVQAKIDELVAKRAVLAERYGRRHPTMQEISRTLDALTKLRDEQVNLALANLRGARDKAVAEEKELAGQLAESEKAALRLDQIGVEYGVLKRAVETQKTIYSQVLSRLNEASISAQLESVNVRIADRAQANRQPISPNLRKTAMILGALALGIIFGYPFCVELLFARVRSGADVEYYLGSNLIGEIGSVRSVRERDRPHIVTRLTDETAAEQFRALFSELQLVSRIDPPKSLLITSTVPGEGKSFVACNLAASFVAHGRRVLLVDADLRRASQHRHYNLENNVGLLRWLDAGGPLAGDLEQDPDLGLTEVSKGLFLLRAGGSTRRATELISGGAITGLVTALQRRFDVLIFDTPPAGVFPDAIAFAQFCHEFIFVCRFGTVSRQQVRSVLSRLHQTGLDFAGIVLNALPAGRGSGHYYYHSYGSTRKYAKHYAGRPAPPAP